MAYSGGASVRGNVLITNFTDDILHLHYIETATTPEKAGKTALKNESRSRSFGGSIFYITVSDVLKWVTSLGLLNQFLY